MKTYALAAAGAAILIGVLYMAKKQPADEPAASDAPRGIRNNNPLNIEFNQRNNWNGQTGTDGRFATFETPFYGIRAGARMLKNYAANYNIRTVREIVGRWAPAVENDVEAYVNSVVKRTGLFPDMYLAPGDYPILIAAMIHHENGQQPYDLALITEATQAGMA
ncbi:structural protein [Arsukibacterium sp.]|uniref:structural protein n=1 Tax=Arsukibacterium sp. TaxID=1977258 RepID=UPI002FDA7EEE